LTSLDFEIHDTVKWVNILLSVPVMVELVLLHGNSLCVIMLDGIQELLCFDDWSMISVETVRTPANGDSVIADLDRQP
jgi:hypothetical protein